MTFLDEECEREKISDRGEMHKEARTLDLQRNPEREKKKSPRERKSRSNKRKTPFMNSVLRTTRELE